MYVNDHLVRKASVGDSARLRIVFTIQKLNVLIIGFFSRLLFKPIAINGPRKILIYRYGKIGDCVCALPAINEISQAFPDAIIDLENPGPQPDISLMRQLMASSHYRKIFCPQDYSALEYFRLLRKEKYDAFVFLPGRKFSLLTNLRKMMYVRLLNIKQAVGWKADFVTLFTQTQEKYIIFQNEVDRLKSLVKNSGIRIQDKNVYPLATSADDSITVDRKMEGLNEKRSNVVLIIGASHDYRKWPIENFEQVIRHFYQKYNFIVLGDRNDRIAARSLERFDYVYNWCGELTIPQSALVIQRSMMTLANDTGPLHLSVAVGTPVIGIFSRWEFSGWWYPPHDGINHVVKMKYISCQTCFKTVCDNDNKCIRAITTGEVIESINSVAAKVSAIKTS